MSEISESSDDSSSTLPFNSDDSALCMRSSIDHFNLVSKTIDPLLKALASLEFKDNNVELIQLILSL